MQPIAYLNGVFTPLSDALVSVEDRGFQFGDSIYEVILIAGGRAVDAKAHLDRLGRSGARMGFAATAREDDHAGVAAALVEKNRIEDGYVYMQVSRGAWPRNMSPSSAPAGGPPTVAAYARPLILPASFEVQRPIAVAPLPDLRWHCCDIKTTALAGALLSRAQANRDGFDDAWLVARDGSVTEATAANAWIVKDGVVWTRPEGQEILGGITRSRLVAIARDLGIPMEIVPFSAEDVATADEAFQTSATALVTPIACFGSRDMGSAADWPVTRRLFEAYMRFARA